MPDRLPSRSDVDPRSTWNAESVFASPGAWDAEVRAIRADIPGVLAFKGRLGEGPEVLLEALRARDDLAVRAERVLVYAGFSSSVDATDQTASAMAEKARGLQAEVRASVAYLEPEILALSQETLERWMERLAPLAVYRHAFDDLRRKLPHVRSAEVEEILGRVSDPFSGTGATASLLTNADFRFDPGRDAEGAEVEVNQGTVLRILASPDRLARQTAWEAYMDRYLEHENTLAALLSTSVKQFVFRTRVRNHPTSLAASLFENAIPLEVYHNLLDVFRANLPTWHRYFALRRRALGVDDLAHFDMWAPLGTEAVSVRYDQAVEMICEGLAPLGAEYVEVLRRGCWEDRWIDVYPNQGKRAGAFSWGAPGTHPFIMMSYADTVYSLSTLAHELGHSMHSYLTWKHQPLVYGDYSLFVAEVASNLHQALVRAHLLASELSGAMRVAILEEAMANFFRYFFLMPTLARLELDTHARVEQGEALTANWLKDRTVELLSEGYGGEVALDHPRLGMLWATFSHLYSDFYVYQYATGISGAYSLAKRIRAEGEPAAEAYRQFLRAGGSCYPLEALALAGVDLSRREPVQDAFDGMREVVDQLEGLV